VSDRVRARAMAEVTMAARDVRDAVTGVERTREGTTHRERALAVLAARKATLREKRERLNQLR
jgi:hypothetical protein